VPAAVAGGAERRKPDWPLHPEAVRRMLTVGQESKKEIPVNSHLTVLDPRFPGKEIR